MSRKSVKCKVDRDSKVAAAEEEEEEEEAAGEKIRGKRRKKAAWSRRGRTERVGPSRWMERRMGSSRRTEEEAAREQR